MSIRVKYLSRGMKPVTAPDGTIGTHCRIFEREDVVFIHDAGCREYDWLLVYDDMPNHDVGTVRGELEKLACPADQTILVTAEPPTIKLYPNCYTQQFGYVLTTHDFPYLPHRNYKVGRGCLHWMADYSLEEAYAMPDYPKSKLFSTVCSSKQMKHTQHHNRFVLTQHVAENMPEMDWFGRGMRPLAKKYDALNDYKYHLAVENYIHPNHWSDKISDPLLGLCLTFYAGDPLLPELLPEGSIVPIPLHDPGAALEIIQKTIRDGEYEKRLPAIREARRLLVTKYNLYDQVVELIHHHAASGAAVGESLRGRHRLRRNPIHALSELGQIVRYRLLQRAV